MHSGDKAFCIPAVVQESTKKIVLKRSIIQADQGSDINVISLGLVNHLQLPKRSLAELGFWGLAMKTADQRETVLHHYAMITLGVKGVWQTIQCFVAPELPGSEHKSLILGIP